MKRTQIEDDEEDEEEHKKERKKPRKRKQYDNLVGVFSQHSSSVNVRAEQQHAVHRPTHNLNLRNTETLDGGGTYSEFVFSNAQSVFVDEFEDNSGSLLITTTQETQPIPNALATPSLNQQPQTLEASLLTTNETTSTTVVEVAVSPTTLQSPDSASTSEEEQREQRRQRVSIKNLLN
jgi:hypothetical protein